MLGGLRICPWAARLGLVLGATVVTLAVLELVARAVVPMSTHHLMFASSADPELGLTLRPGADFTFEGSPNAPLPPSRVHISAGGLRDRDPVQPKPNGTRRLVCVGDSTTFGWGVEAEQAFCQRLGGLLPAGWETVNLGVPGYNATQEVRRLEVHGLPLSPDIVLFLFDDNDLEPAHAEANDGSWLAWLVDHSALAHWVHARLAYGEGPEAAPEHDGLAAVLAAYSRLAQLAATHGFRVMVFLPAPDDQRALTERLDTLGVPWASIRAAFDGPIEQLTFPGDGHPTAEGHRRLAELIARKLTARGLLTPRLR